MEQPKPKSSLTVQQGRITSDEKEILKQYFLGNEALLLALRNLFFGFKLTDGEKTILGQLHQGLIRQLLRKIFLPEITRDIPIGQSVDLWMTVKLDIPERDKMNIRARQLLIDDLEKALKTLDTLDNSGVSLKIDKTPEGITYRNTFISHIELQLLAIRSMANEKIESSEQQTERLLKDSMK